MAPSTIDYQPEQGAASGSYAPVNGLKMYYETHGHGEKDQAPLVMLPGGLGGAAMFGQALDVMAKSRQVIAVELQGHAHTADIDRPFRWESLADDVAALIRYLGLPRADVCGYSLGGGVALETAIRHPDLVRKLVLVSAPCHQDGWYPQVRVDMGKTNAENARGWIGSPMQKAYAAVAPQPENWPLLAEKTGELLRREYDRSREFAALPMPVLIALGDADAVRPAYAVEMFEMLGGGQRDAGWDGAGMPRSRLAVLPGTTHYNIFASPLLVPVVNIFLDEVREDN
ncbi:MAG TPA: alpha/beta hydrolase [Anaerolineaceae bacterium]